MTNLRTTSTRRLLSAIALMGVTSLTAACGGDDGNGGGDKDAAASQSAQAGDDGAGGDGQGTADGEASEGEGDAEGADGAEGSGGEGGGEGAAGGEGGAAAADAPQVPLGDMLLAEDAVPNVTLMRVPDGDLQSAFEQMKATLAAAEVTPPECASLGTNGDISAEELARTSALAQGTTPGANPEAPTAVSVSISNDPRNADYDLAGDVAGCENMTAVMDLGTQKVTSNSTTEVSDAAAPEGVENFGAITQRNAIEGLGPAGETETYMLHGKVRGIGISVSMVSTGGALSPEQRSLGEQVFAAQAEKVRNA